MNRAWQAVLRAAPRTYSNVPQRSSRVASSGRSGSKRTSASSGPSCAAVKAWVRPTIVRQVPVSRADSWMCPWSETRGPRSSRKRRIGDASDVGIERHTFHGLAVEGRAVERCLVRRRVKEEDRLGEVVVPGQSREVLLDRRPLGLVGRDRHAPVRLLPARRSPGST